MWTIKTLSSKVRCKKINAFGDRLSTLLIERYLLLWIYCIEAIWTRQSDSQLAAKLGSISSCGLHSYGRFLTWWEKVWAVGRQAESVQLFWKGKSFNDRSNFVCLSACGNRWSLLKNPFIDSKTFIWGFTVTASRCFDIRVGLNETNLMPASGQDGCVESHSPDQISQWSSSPLLLPFPSSNLSPFASLPRNYFMLTCWNSPPSVERHPSLALSSHFRRTCESAQNEYDKHLNLSGACKMPARWFIEGNTLTGRMFIPWQLGTCKRGLEAIFHGLSSQTERNILTNWTRVKQHVFYPNNYHV